jgi:hypothetical protein
MEDTHGFSQTLQLVVADALLSLAKAPRFHDVFMHFDALPVIVKCVLHCYYPFLLILRRMFNHSLKPDNAAAILEILTAFAGHPEHSARLVAV